jgi:hypothetical protein
VLNLTSALINFWWGTLLNLVSDNVKCGRIVTYRGQSSLLYRLSGDVSPHKPQGTTIPQAPGSTRSPKVHTKPQGTCEAQGTTIPQAPGSTRNMRSPRVPQTTIALGSTRNPKIRPQLEPAALTLLGTRIFVPGWTPQL